MSHSPNRSLGLEAVRKVPFQVSVRPDQKSRGFTGSPTDRSGYIRVAASEYWGKDDFGGSKGINSFDWSDSRSSNWRGTPWTKVTLAFRARHQRQKNAILFEHSNEKQNFDDEADSNNCGDVGVNKEMWSRWACLSRLCN